MTVDELRAQARGLIRPNYEEMVQQHLHEQARSRGAATGGRGDDPAAHAEDIIRADVVYESMPHRATRPTSAGSSGGASASAGADTGARSLASRARSPPARRQPTQRQQHTRAQRHRAREHLQEYEGLRHEDGTRCNEEELMAQALALSEADIAPH